MCSVGSHGPPEGRGSCHDIPDEPLGNPKIVHRQREVPNIQPSLCRHRVLKEDDRCLKVELRCCEPTAPLPCHLR